MRKLRTALVLAVSLAMAGCQTLDGVTVNGRDINKDYAEAQASSDYAWLWVLGAVAAGALIWILVDDDDDDDFDPDDDPVVNPLSN
jgi:predicted small secreted protein